MRSLPHIFPNFVHISRSKLGTLRLLGLPLVQLADLPVGPGPLCALPRRRFGFSQDSFKSCFIFIFIFILLFEQVNVFRDVVSEAEVRRFCRESRYLRLERGCSLEVEYTGGGSSTSLQNGLEDPDSDALYYLVLRAVDRSVRNI